MNDEEQAKAKLEATWDWNLTNHKPTDEATKKMETLRELAKDFAEGIIKLGPIGREQSLALTHLEESLFYANASIARTEAADVEGQS